MRRSLRTLKEEKGVYDFNCPDVLTSSADKAVRRRELSLVQQGHLLFSKLCSVRKAK